MARRPDWLELARQRLYDPAWLEVLSLLAGVWDLRGRDEGRECGLQSTAYVTWLLQENANDLLDRPLLLAALAAGEARQSLSEDLLNNVFDELVHNFIHGPDFLDRERMTTHLAVVGRHATRGLLRALEDKYEKEPVRWRAARALGQLGQAGPEVIQALIKVLQDKNEKMWVREGAAEALGQLGQAGPEVIHALLKALDNSGLVQKNAAKALGRLGQAEPEVIQALLKALQDKKKRWWACAGAAEALGQLGQAAGPEVIQALLKALNDRQVVGPRNRAMEALGQLGQATPEVIQALLKALQDEDKYVRNKAVKALGQLGQATPEVTQALLKALQDEDKYVRNRRRWGSWARLRRR